MYVLTKLKKREVMKSLLKHELVQVPKTLKKKILSMSVGRLHSRL